MPMMYQMYESQTEANTLFQFSELPIADDPCSPDRPVSAQNELNNMGVAGESVVQEYSLNVQNGISTANYLNGYNVGSCPPESAQTHDGLRINVASDSTVAQECSLNFQDGLSNANLYNGFNAHAQNGCLNESAYGSAMWYGSSYQNYWQHTNTPDILTDATGTFAGFPLVNDDMPAQPSDPLSPMLSTRDVPIEFAAHSSDSVKLARAWDNCLERHAQARSPASPEFTSIGDFPPPSSVVGSAHSHDSSSEAVGDVVEEHTRKKRRAVSKRQVHFGSYVPKCDEDLLLSQRRHLWRRLNGRLYRFGYASKSGIEVWRCVNKKCRGTATLDGDIFELKNRCTVWQMISKNKIKAMMLINKAKILWARGIKVRDACDLIRDESTPEVLRLLPDPDALARTVRRSMEGSRVFDEYPFSSKADEEWLQYGGDSILLHNNTASCPPAQALVVFGTRFGMEALKNGSQQVHADGEFKRAPPNYKQCYNIGVIFEGKYTNVFTVLLGSKEQQMYEQMWTVLSQLGDFSAVRGFHLDFELGAINSIRSVFPSVPVYGCWFHLGQTLMAQADEKGLCIEEDETDAKLFNWIYFLAYLPAADIRSAFLEVLTFVGTLPQSSRVRYEGFLSYFSTWYVGRTDTMGREIRARYPAELWSIYDRVMVGLPVTNNASESHNASFGRHCPRNPTMFVYVRSMKAHWNHLRSMRQQGKAKNKLKSPSTGLTVTEGSLKKKDMLLKPRYAGQTWLSYLTQLQVVD